MGASMSSTVISDVSIKTVRLSGNAISVDVPTPNIKRMTANVETPIAHGTNGLLPDGATGFRREISRHDIFCQIRCDLEIA